MYEQVNVIGIVIHPSSRFLAQLEMDVMMKDDLLASDPGVADD